MTKNDITLSLANVTKRFGDLDAVSDVTLSVGKGEIVGFVGPNGAGKSTTIAMLMGYLRPSKGSITILGKRITTENAHTVHQAIGYVAGDMVLPSLLTGKQFIDFTASYTKRDTLQYESLVNRLVPVLNKPLKTLSRGNKQKIALIAALQHSPQVLVLDEPTSGLDPLMQEIFFSVLRTESERGTTILMSSHILSEVSSISSRIVFMKAGKFILDKPISAITNKLGKHIIITTQEVAKLKKYLPPEATYVSHTSTQLEILVSRDSVKPIMQWLINKKFTDISITERDLDDVFHDLYRVRTKKV